MLDFKPFGKDFIQAVRPYVGGDPRICTKAIGVVYMWAGYLGTHVAAYEGGCVLKDNYTGEDIFLLPRGDAREEGVRLIEEYVRQTGGELIFGSVDDEEAAFLASRYPAIEFKSHRDYSDYLYNAEDIRTFKGKKYHGQRNHVNRFMHDYPQYVFAPFGREELPRIFAFLDEHEALVPRSENERTEYECCRRLLGAWDELSLLGAKIEVDGKIVAISVGERSGDTLIIHIEKAIATYNGVYPTMCTLFAQAFSDGCRYINREDDAGDPGLRTSKTQYHPIELVPKRRAYCRLSRRPEIPTLFTERLVIDSFALTDMADYAALATDDERNLYWGYDYKADLGEETPNADYFARVLAEDEGRGVCYSRKIARTDGAFVGEAVVYNFRVDGSCELGLRVTRDAAGQGYGREAYRALADAMLPLTGRLHARCYKANAPSREMILAAGFTLERESEDMYYFIRK